MMRFRHLDYPDSAPVEELGAAALDDLLDRGDISAWAPLARAIRADPWGEISRTVLALCDAHPMYGTSALWRAWIERLRGQVTPERRQDKRVWPVMSEVFRRSPR